MIHYCRPLYRKNRDAQSVKQSSTKTDNSVSKQESTIIDQDITGQDKTEQE